MKKIKGHFWYSVHPSHPSIPSVNSALRASSCKSCPGPRRDTVGAYLPYPQPKIKILTLTTNLNKNQIKIICKKNQIWKQKKVWTGWTGTSYIFELSRSTRATKLIQSFTALCAGRLYVFGMYVNILVIRKPTKIDEDHWLIHDWVLELRVIIIVYK